MRRNVAALGLLAASLMVGIDVIAAKDYLVPEILKSSPYAPSGSPFLTVPWGKEPYRARDPYKSVFTKVTPKVSLRALEECGIAQGSAEKPGDMRCVHETQPGAGTVIRISTQRANPPGWNDAGYWNLLSLQLEGPLAAGTIRLPSDNVRIIETGCGNMACSVALRAAGTLTLVPDAGSWVVAMDLLMYSTFWMSGVGDPHSFPLVESVRIAEGTGCQLNPYGGWECA
jgi:hypothetical protein